MSISKTSSAPGDCAFLISARKVLPRRSWVGSPVCHGTNGISEVVRVYQSFSAGLDPLSLTLTRIVGPGSCTSSRNCSETLTCWDFLHGLHFLGVSEELVCALNTSVSSAFWRRLPLVERVLRISAFTFASLALSLR